jgi:hypothetical protein
MARNTEASQQIIISAATRRGNTPKKTLLIYVKEKEPNTNPRNNQSEALKFNNNLIKQHKHNTSLSLRCSRKNRMTGNKLYEANHLCMMKIALIKEKTTR